MIFFGGVLGLVALAVWIFCIIDVVTTPAPQVRFLPKLAWVAVVVFLIDLGSLAWLLAGRPWARAMTPGGAPAGVGAPGFGRSGATPRRRATTRPANPDDDDEFLASLAKRNERRDDPPADGGNGPQPA